MPNRVDVTEIRYIHFFTFICYKMTEQQKKSILTAAAVLLAAVTAYTFRLIGKGSFYPTLFSYLRSFIYIGLYAAWGLSIRQRIVQEQVARYLTSVSVLLILWFSFRTVKYFIFWQPDAIRYLPYGRRICRLCSPSRRNPRALPRSWPTGTIRSPSRSWSGPSPSRSGP